MLVKCKYCGNSIEINGKYLNPQPGGYVCSECSSYCNKECKIACSVKGWHYEPCLSCEHNPRNKIVK